MDTLARELDEAVAAWDQRGWPRPDVVMVSGSGLAVDMPNLSEDRNMLLSDLLPFEVHPVIGHPHGVELLEPVPGRFVLYHRGRVHSYQGYTAAETVFGVRLAGRLGARTLVMTNAAGCIDPERSPGDLMLIEDHINLTGLNPLRGEPPAEWGPRFPDLVDAYDPELRALAASVAAELEIELGSGVYAGLAGPSYETPAEIRMLQVVGANLVGMSTVLEVIAARHLGMRCLCFSLVSNLAAGTTGEPLHHDEVLEAGREAALKVGRLLSALVERPELYKAAG